jgi:hypothetical protein
MSQDPLSQQAWQWLGRELDRWSNAGLRAQFWWRDDDASDSSEALDRLLQLAEERQVPLALAVIPARLQPGLVDSLKNQGLITVLQHGYAHANHAAAGQRKLELGGRLPGDRIASELRLGRQTLALEFGECFVAALVPPWNRIDGAAIEALPELGFSGISTMKARRAAYPAPGLLQVNTHLDPINWRHDSGFLGVYPAIAILVQHLVARRSGYRDIDEPSGILSHHMVQNDATWRFLDNLLQFLSAHPAADFIDARDIWRPRDVSRRGAEDAASAEDNKLIP